MEVAFTFTVIGPLTFHGDREAMMRPIKNAIRLGDVRKRLYALSEIGAPKIVLDAFIRERLRLEVLNREYRRNARQ